MNFEGFYNDFWFLLVLMVMMKVANTIGGHSRSRCRRIEANGPATTPDMRRMAQQRSTWPTHAHTSSRQGQQSRMALSMAEESRVVDQATSQVVRLLLLQAVLVVFADVVVCGG